MVIVGGGTAGWMCAAALSRILDLKTIDVTLVESDEIGIVGVGEATIPPITTFNSVLGIDENAFIRETQGTFKLGIEFVDWSQPGTRYFHPFGKFGRDRNTIKFHQFWLKLRQDGGSSDIGELGEYNLSTVAAYSGRFVGPRENHGELINTMRYAYHFDAALYAKYLRKYAEARGVHRVEGKILDVELNGENGFVAAVKLESGVRIGGELFVDCSGFRSLLLGEALKTPFIDWSEWLPCDRAWAVPSESVGEPLPYTRSTADSAGWRWRIPLQHRVGNGHVYCSEFISDESAREVLLRGLDGKLLADPRLLRFKAGRRARLWVRNCVAIGLSGGFLEPLESTSIHLIQTGILRLIALFPDTGFSASEITEFNRLTVREYEYVRDFVILHYYVGMRSDTDFWRRNHSMKVPESLQHRIDLFKGKGRVFRDAEDLFTEDSWLAVLLGQDVEPAGYDPLVDAIPPGQLQSYVLYIRETYRKAASLMPTHSAYIRQHCSATRSQSPT